MCDYALLGTDSDSDTVGDSCDNCPFMPNSDQANSDADVFGNACDNCPLDTNVSQADLDMDMLGDACDPDMDGDGITNIIEVGLGMNPMKKDSDGDRIDDCTEACPANDGSCLSNGVCTFAKAADTDGDKTIDALDDDSDADGLTDFGEAGDGLLTTPPGDSDGDGIPDYRDPLEVSMSSSGMGGAGGMGGMGNGGASSTGGTGGMAGAGNAGGMGGVGGTSGMGGMGGAAGKGGMAGSGGMGGVETGGHGAGNGPVQNDGGCDCSTVSSKDAPHGSALLVGISALVARLRRRRASRIHP